MSNMIFSVLLAAAAGVGTIIQQALNANLRTELNSVAWSGFVSYAVGLVCMALLVIALREPLPALGTMARVPWWTWSGGLFGAIFIALGVILVPKLGATTFIALLIAGQMMASVTFDHFGWLGLDQRPIDLSRVIGVLLLIAGVTLIRR